MRRSLTALAREIPARPPRGSRPLTLSVTTEEPLVAKDEVVVVVMGAQGALLRRTAFPSGTLDFADLELRLLGAEAAVQAAAATAANTEVPALSRAEAALLDEAGLAGGAAAGRPGALERSQIAFHLLVQSSFSLAEAARVLGVTPARLRQRLAARTLLGLKEGRSWRLPRFQFTSRGRLVRGIERVLPEIRPDAHPLAIQRWFQSPHRDLVVGENDEAVSPLQWLGAGNPPEAVADLASEI